MGDLKNKYTALLKFDITKAYDTVDHGILIKKIERLGDPKLTNLIKLLMNLYRIKVNTGTKAIKIGRGVP